jgi:tetratricopeptide (TPR) repeat protein
MNNAGEGWVSLQFTVTPAGTAENISVVDAIGSELFWQESAAAIAKGKWAAQPHAHHFAAFHFQYLITGENRAGVHNLAARDYDLALANRKRGDYRRSIEILQNTMKMPLNMYEFATTSYGLTVSYLGLGDWRRALRHARHMAIGDGEFADKGQVRSTLSMAAELAAQDNSFHESLCYASVLKTKLPDFVPSARLKNALARAEQEIGAATPVRTEVEIVEPVRVGLPSVWSHRVLRRSLTFGPVQGVLKNARVVCPRAVVDRPFPITAPIDVDTSGGTCLLYVYGEPGARFAIEER